MRFLYSILVAIGLTLTGCANFHPSLGSELALDPQSGYIAGYFGSNNKAKFGFVLKSEDGQEYTMAFGNTNVSNPSNSYGETTTIKVPPGFYKVAEWIVVGPSVLRSPMRNSILNTAFKVEAGKVVHLGSYISDSTSRSGLINRVVHDIHGYRVDPLFPEESFVQSEFKKAYPKLDKLTFQCLLCLDKFERIAPK